MPRILRLLLQAKAHKDRRGPGAEMAHGSLEDQQKNMDLLQVMAEGRGLSCKVRDGWDGLVWELWAFRMARDTKPGVGPNGTVQTIQVIYPYVMTWTIGCVTGRFHLFHNVLVVIDSMWFGISLIRKPFPVPKWAASAYSDEADTAV